LWRVDYLQGKLLIQYIIWKKEQPEHKLLPAINNARSLYYQDSKKNLCPHQVKKNAKHASKELDPEDIFAPGNEKKRMLSHLRLGNCYETIQIPQYNAKKTTNP
jgi:DNA modification methylase